jgi:hypothetical protein
MTANEVDRMIKLNNVGQEHASKAQIAKIVAIINLVLAALGIVIQIILAIIGAAATQAS